MSRALFGLVLVLSAAGFGIARAETISDFVPFIYDTATPDVLRLEGEINSRTPLSLTLALRQYPQIKTLSLSSPGGQVMAALPAALDIRAAGLMTTIPAEAKCYSACALLFFAGVERSAEGELGVHQVAAENAASGQFAVGDIIAVLDDFDVPNELIVKMLQTPPNQMYVLEPPEMIRLGLLGGSSTQDPGTPNERPTTSRPINPPVQPVTPPDEQTQSDAEVCYVDDVRPPDAWLALRSEPGSRSGRQLRKLMPGQSFTMLGESRGDWYHVALPDGLTGWVSWEVSRWISC